jgi:hypothetical protein
MADASAAAELTKYSFHGNDDFDIWRISYFLNFATNLTHQPNSKTVNVS